MIGRLGHVAIVVPDLDAAMARYRDVMGTKVGMPVFLPEHGVVVAILEFPNTNVELLHPLGDDSPIAGFLARNPLGGLHHICYEVTDIYSSMDVLRAKGFHMINPEPKVGAHGNLVVFLKPKEHDGVLVELEQVS